MYRYLKAHPDVFFPNVKELHAFGSDLMIRETYRSPRDICRVSKERYAEFFRGVRTEKIIGDASSFLIVSKNAPAEIATECGQVKILALLRDPVSMLSSWHRHLLKTLDEDLVDLGEALRAEGARRKGERIPPRSAVVCGLLYSEFLKYVPNIRRYEEQFGPENVKVTLLDDLRDDPASVYREVCGFLDIDPSFLPSFEVHNRGVVLRFPGINRFLDNPSRPLKPLASLVGYRLPWMRRILVDLLHKLNQTRAPEKKVRSHDFDVVRELALSNIVRLESYLGRSLADWKSLLIGDQGKRDHECAVEGTSSEVP
jgi:hypothetical protein